MPARCSIARPFTLTEVVIATVILAMAAAASLAIIGGATANLYRAESRWLDQHITENVAEYYLLLGADAPRPQDLLPNGYDASCELLEVDDIHEDALEPIHEWRLGEYHITVTNPQGLLVGEANVRKLVKEDDLQ